MTAKSTSTCDSQITGAMAMNKLQCYQKNSGCAIMATNIYVVP